MKLNGFRIKYDGRRQTEDGSLLGRALGHACWQAVIAVKSPQRQALARKRGLETESPVTLPIITGT